MDEAPCFGVIRGMDRWGWMDITRCGEVQSTLRSSQSNKADQPVDYCCPRSVSPSCLTFAPGVKHQFTFKPKFFLQILRPNFGQHWVNFGTIPQQDAPLMSPPWWCPTLMHLQQDLSFPVWVKMHLNILISTHPDSKSRSLSPWSQRCCWLRRELEWPGRGSLTWSVSPTHLLFQLVKPNNIFPVGLVKLTRSSPWWRRGSRL